MMGRQPKRQRTIAVIHRCRRKDHAKTALARRKTLRYTHPIVNPARTPTRVLETTGDGEIWQQHRARRCTDGDERIKAVRAPAHIWRGANAANQRRAVDASAYRGDHGRYGIRDEGEREQTLSLIHI